MVRDEDYRWSIIGIVSTGKCEDYVKKMVGND